MGRPPNNSPEKTNGVKPRGRRVYLLFFYILHTHIPLLSFVQVRDVFAIVFLFLLYSGAVASDDPRQEALRNEHHEGSP